MNDTQHNHLSHLKLTTSWSLRYQCCHKVRARLWSMHGRKTDGFVQRFAYSPRGRLWRPLLAGLAPFNESLFAQRGSCRDRTIIQCRKEVGHMRTWRSSTFQQVHSTRVLVVFCIKKWSINSFCFGINKYAVWSVKRLASIFGKPTAARIRLCSGYTLLCTLFSLKF